MKKSTLQSTRSKASEPADKPSKPRADFPLFPHASGRWAKKVRGKLKYFGKVADDPKGAAAFSKWSEQKDDLLAGRIPQGKRQGLSIHDACNRFLHAKKLKVESGELVHSTWHGYQIACRRIKKFFGSSRIVEDLRPTDFEDYLRDITKTNGLVGIGNHVRLARMVFGYAWKADLIQRPVKFGPSFVQPSARSIRKQKKSRMYEANEVQRMLDAAGPTMKAMILLGINCGFGNGDVERLPIAAVDLKGGWIVFPRPKTGSERKIPLWPETVAAIKEALNDRPTPIDKENDAYLFLTSRGRTWWKEGTRYLSEQFRYFLQAIDDHDAKEAEQHAAEPPTKLYRPGIGFYSLRHVFETIGGESRDQVAVDSIMGHERGDMASIYRERVSDERLETVVNTIRHWLWPNADQSSDEVASIPFGIVG